MKPRTAEQLGKIFDIGREVGIGHAMFINFGTLLGCVREGGLIEHDDDTDVSIRSDWITREQEADFYDSLEENHMFEYRRRKVVREDVRRFLWMSLKFDLESNKSCIWMMFPWKGHLYHCKGNQWVKKIGLKPQVNRALPNHGKNLLESASIMKGNTLKCFDKLIPVKFCGTTVNIPSGYGTLLDEYYPNWAVPGGGSSARYNIVLIQKWEDESSWLVIKE